MRMYRDRGSGDRDLGIEGWFVYSDVIVGVGRWGLGGGRKRKEERECERRTRT